MSENDYAQLTNEAVIIIKEAETKIKAQTGSDVVLVAYPKNGSQN
ncbi:hypothetical protein [Youxingia wuxianensis]|nr:hypothetical protein [Youxingia wuxianensis]